MTCTPFQNGNVTGILCGRGQQKRACHGCGRAAAYQCDSPVYRNNVKGTCDKWLCERCRNNIAENVDLCRAHFAFWEANGKRFVLGGEVQS